jgi:hypothetical protein
MDIREGCQHHPYYNAKPIDFQTLKGKQPAGAVYMDKKILKFCGIMPKRYTGWGFILETRHD